MITTAMRLVGDVFQLLHEMEATDLIAQSVVEAMRGAVGNVTVEHEDVAAEFVGAGFKGVQ